MKITYQTQYHTLKNILVNCVFVLSIIFFFSCKVSTENPRKLPKKKVNPSRKKNLFRSFFTQQKILRTSKLTKDCGPYWSIICSWLAPTTIFLRATHVYKSSQNRVFFGKSPVRPSIFRPFYKKTWRLTIFNIAVRN